MSKMKSNTKKAALGTLPAAILATVAIVLMLILFTGAINLFGGGDIKKLESRNFLVEDGNALIYLLNSPVKFGNDESRFSDIIRSYASSGDSSPLQTGLDSTFGKSFGGCYALKIETEEHTFEHNWEVDTWKPSLVESAKNIFEKLERPETKMSLPYATIYFRNSFAYCLYFSSLEECNAQCNVR